LKKKCNKERNNATEIQPIAKIWTSKNDETEKGLFLAFLGNDDENACIKNGNNGDKEEFVSFNNNDN